MACKYNDACGCCDDCERKVYVSTVTFADGTLTLTLPDDVSYNNGCKYCFIITTTLPAAIINTPVVAVIGTGTVEFPVLTRCGAQVVAQQLQPRKRYPFRVSTSATTGSIIILRCLPESGNQSLASLNDAVTGGA